MKREGDRYRFPAMFMFVPLVYAFRKVAERSHCTDKQVKHSTTLV